MFGFNNEGKNDSFVEKLKKHKNKNAIELQVTQGCKIFEEKMPNPEELSFLANYETSSIKILFTTRVPVSKQKEWLQFIKALKSIELVLISQNVSKLCMKSLSVNLFADKILNLNLSSTVVNLNKMSRLLVSCSKLVHLKISGTPNDLLNFISLPYVPFTISFSRRPDVGFWLFSALLESQVFDKVQLPRKIKQQKMSFVGIHPGFLYGNDIKNFPKNISKNSAFKLFLSRVVRLSFDVISSVLLKFVLKKCEIYPIIVKHFHLRSILLASPS